MANQACARSSPVSMCTYQHVVSNAFTGEGGEVLSGRSRSMASNRCQVDLDLTKILLPLNCGFIVHYGAEVVLRDAWGALS